jgi:phytoene dehydrogenase-like protein
MLGGGHSGLDCAGYLAKAGKSVRLFEARDILGGAAVTEECHPGFRNSVYSYFVSLLHPQFISDLSLERHGLAIRADWLQLHPPRACW